MNYKTQIPCICFGLTLANDETVSPENQNDVAITSKKKRINLAKKIPSYQIYNTKPTTAQIKQKNPPVNQKKFYQEKQPVHPAKKLPSSKIYKEEQAIQKTKQAVYKIEQTVLPIEQKKTISLTCNEEKFQQDIKTAIQKSINEVKINFESFCLQYAEEVKENYLLRRIIDAFQIIQFNKQSCRYILQRIEHFIWTKERFLQEPVKDEQSEILEEFDNEIHKLKIKYNQHAICSDEDWNSLEIIFKNLSNQDLKLLKKMLFF